jgi:uncharacterized repeat protein (TIGR03803 family)
MSQAAFLNRRTCLGFAMGLASDLALPHGLGELGAIDEEAMAGDPVGLHYRVAHHFISEEGASSDSGILVASDGRGYSTNAGSGTFGFGTVYNVDGARRVKVLHSFAGRPRDGAYPQSPVVEADDGALYGVTSAGGSRDGGIAYRIAQGSATTLHEFGVAPGDGSHLWGGIIFASDGQFYGAAQNGGAHGQGMVYRMDKAGNVTPVWQLGGPGDPGQPMAAPREGADGRLYGTSRQGGEFGRGTIYSVAKDGSNPLVMHSFRGDDGNSPQVPVTFGSDGSIYGVTTFGGDHGIGTVHRLDPAGVLTVLHSFDQTDGREPNTELLEYQPGVFIGTTTFGGLHVGSFGGGVAFKVLSDGTYQILHKFGRIVHGEPDGIQPSGALLLGPGGQVTGTCRVHGTYGNGVIWTMVPVLA